MDSWEFKQPLDLVGGLEPWNFYDFPFYGTYGGWKKSCTSG